jgi:hypothetical protein
MPGTTRSQLLSPDTVGALVERPWWQPTVAAACGPHHTLHSSEASCPMASDSTMASKAVRNT